MVSKIDRATNELINQLEPELARKIVQAINQAQTDLDLALFVELLEQDRLEEALAVLEIQPGDLSLLVLAITNAFFAGGMVVFESIPKRRRRVGPYRVGPFNPQHPIARDALQARINTLTQGLLADGRGNAAKLARKLLNEGRNARQVALTLAGRINKATGLREGGILGLSDHQANSIGNAINQLASGDPAEMRKFLNRKLRDARFDGVIRKAIDKSKPVDPVALGKVINRLEQRNLAHRAKVIAEHESRLIVNQGRHISVNQYVERGVLKQEQLVRTWDSRSDSRVRDTHAAMHGQRVYGMEEPFVSPSGARMMHPHDRSLGAPASEIINCRCRESIRIKFK